MRRKLGDYYHFHSSVGVYKPHPQSLSNYRHFMSALPELKATSVPFTVYDVLGYLLPGLFFLTLLVFEYDMSKALTYYLSHNLAFFGIESEAVRYKLPYIMRFLSWQQTPTDFKFVPFLLLVVLAYLIEHVISAVSSTLIEKLFLSTSLQYPDSNLFHELVEKRDTPRRVATWRLLHQETRWWVKPWRLAVSVGSWASHAWQSFWRFCFPRYCHPLDTAFTTAFKRKIDARFGCQVELRNYYWLCYADIIRHLPTSYQRNQHFVSLYGFARNTCTAFWLYVALRYALRWVYGNFGITYVLTPASHFILWTYVAVGAVLFLSYLKLFRRQTMEMFYAFYALHSDPLVPVTVEAGTEEKEA